MSTSPGCPRCAGLARKAAGAAADLVRVARAGGQAPEAAVAVLERLTDYTVTMQVHCAEEHTASVRLRPAEVFG